MRRPKGRFVQKRSKGLKKNVKRKKQLNFHNLFKELRLRKEGVASKTFVDPQEQGVRDSSGFELPDRYNEDKMVLLVRDPWWIFAYWEVTPGREQEVTSRMTEEGLARESTVLRVYDVTDTSFEHAHSYFDIGTGSANNWYVDVGAPDRQWVAELGFRARGGRFFMLVRSNVVRTPRSGVSDVLDEEWMMPDEFYRKLFGPSGGVLNAGSSLNLFSGKLFPKPKPR